MKEELRSVFFGEMDNKRRARAELEDKVKELTTKMDAFLGMARPRPSDAKYRSARWSPLDSEHEACVGGFKPFSHATGDKKFAEENLPNIAEDQIFVKPWRVNPCYIRFQSPDERLAFLQSR